MQATRERVACLHYIDISENFSFHKCLLPKKLLTPFTFSVCAFLASGLLLGQIKMRRVVEYPFRRRTTVRQRRISAREKVNIIKRRQPAARIACLHYIDIIKKFRLS